MAPDRDWEEYFAARTVRDEETGCLRWTLHRNPVSGYGMLQYRAWADQPLFAHRVTYLVFVGPIPDGFEVDHVWARGCRYRDCVERTHLDAVSPAENTERFWDHSRADECPQGHPFDAVNTGVNSASGHRYCRACARDRMAAKRGKVDA